MTLIIPRGFAVLSRSQPAPGDRDLASALTAAGIEGADLRLQGDIQTATWGLSALEPGRDEALLLCASARRHDMDLDGPAALDLLATGGSALSEVLPAFAAAGWIAPDRVSVAADYLGFRHLFHAQGGGWAIISTSSLVVASMAQAPLDHEAVALQSLLGWQLGQRTLFSGVEKLRAGALATVFDGRLGIEVYDEGLPAAPVELDEAVTAAAEGLRSYLSAYLEDHPDAGLQLTGGQDSRLLLSAVPAHRRRGLRVVTLGVAGDPDVDIAADFARRYGMEHEILSLSGLDQLEPADAYALVVQSARRLDLTADPVAHAALTVAESASDPAPRISGLGGEVARGFYYLGPPTDAPVSERRARRLASWRMFVNEAVAAEALDPAFVEWARESAARDVVRTLTATGQPWMAATDALYLRHRMQRWGGVTETAVCLDREVVNPMLDHRFIALANALPPRVKRHSRFLSRLQLALDPELGAIPLEGRPPPAAYATDSVLNSLEMARSTARKFGRKARQRLRRQNRPPAGGDVLAARVVDHWRAHPALLEGVRTTDVFSEQWLDEMLGGRRDPAPSAVALLVNLSLVD